MYSSLIEGKGNKTKWNLPVVFGKPAIYVQAHCLLEMLYVGILCLEWHFDKTKMTLKLNP